MPAGEVLQQQPQKSGGSFSRGMRRAFSSFTGGSRKVGLCAKPYTA